MTASVRGLTNDLLYKQTNHWAHQSPEIYQGKRMAFKNSNLEHVCEKMLKLTCLLQASIFTGLFMILVYRWQIT
jgi:hypothetical protein